MSELVHMVRDERQRKANLKLGLTLATVAIVFGLGYVAKIVFFGR